jgi:hypothetical protein
MREVALALPKDCRLFFLLRQPTLEIPLMEHIQREHAGG